MSLEPRATYRLQFGSSFGFEQATLVSSYLSKLGISHLYASPYLQAVAGSPHGYNIVDASRVNEELGGAEAHAHFCQTLKTLGLSQMVDLVPNHMAIPGRQNPWWWDVLKNGPSSRYADYFDVDWESSEERWPNKVLLPVLEDHYGRVLEEGLLQLTQKDGVFLLHYHEHVFPIDSSSLVAFLSRVANACGSDFLAFLAESHARLPKPTATLPRIREIRHRDKAILLNLLARLCREEPEINEKMNAEVAFLNQNPDALDSLLDQQNYRLAFWRTASRDLGYRRFFDIKDLAGLRIEDREVFQAVHALPILWMQKGWIQALRIDHPDGLRDPTEYFCQLYETFPNAWIVAEKILAPFEKLPSEWPIAGTTGYEFLYLLGNLFIDSRNEYALTAIYENFIGEQADFQSIVHECKRLVIKELLGSELNRLTSLFVDICERHRRQRDYTRHELQEAICETAVSFPVYRSYVSIKNEIRYEDQQFISQAIEGAISASKNQDLELYYFLKDLLLLRIEGKLEGELAMRFQQLTGPAMAKGVEDTAFYLFNRFVSLNEVGGDPSHFGITLSEFHQACEVAQKERPLSMLASTTHDTKRSEDVRARLALLSEIPEKWDKAVRSWSNHNEHYRQGNFPDRNTEYLLYQTLVGAWPISIDRTLAYMEKAVREAKKYTSWIHPNETYEKSLRDFILSIMEDVTFLSDLESFVSPLVPFGWINSLAQILIKLTAPGVPDIYQGTELWDLTLVDPDNRQPVDFNLCQNLLEELDSASVKDILARMDEGLPKLWVIRQVLKLRKKQPEPFSSEGSYRPFYAQGLNSDSVIAYSRGERIITVAPRFSLQCDNNWGETFLELPKGLWYNLLSEEKFEGGPIEIKDLFSLFPVALLTKV